jgi:peptidoglycan/LPS O-acetylase OafA/YrhL
VPPSDSTSATNAPTSWIPSLDGIRAISIAIVVVAHSGLPILVNGSTGVTIFFFLSGFLITTLMRKEVEANGSLDLKNFFARRALRIFPPMYLALAVGTTASAIGPVDGNPSPWSILSQAGHLTNYWIISNGRAEVPASTLAFWSLAVEEHFYLAFPLLLPILYRSFGSRHRVAAFLAAACVAALTWRCWLVFGRGVDFDRIYLATDTRVDSILLGAIMALSFNPHLDPIPGTRRAWTMFAFPAAGVIFWRRFRCERGRVI